MQRIVALDPGGTTGIATVRFDDGGYEWSFSELGPYEHHDELWEFLYNTCKPWTTGSTIVCESFEFRQNRQRDNINLMSREYIGVVKLFRAILNVPVVFQTAGMAKPFVTDEKLKAMDLYYTRSKHARDATRHALYYMITKLKRHDLIESWKDL